MLMIDLRCSECGYTKVDFIKRSGMREPPYTCPRCHHHTLDRVHLQAAAVHGDEIDIYIKHGLCNDDGTPRRYTSKADIRRDVKMKGLRCGLTDSAAVHHIASPGTDKNRKRNTQRFV